MSSTPDPDEARRLIMAAGQIHMTAFEIAVGILTGLALICFFARMAIRLKYQKRLRLDDVFLIIAAVCLCVSTGILYHICYFLYMHAAASLVPNLLPYLIENFNNLINLDSYSYPFLALIWTTTFAVKGCFLAFMRPLVWHISRLMNWYYWFIVVFCVLSWAYSVVDPFIICPYFGMDAIQCFTSTVSGGKILALTGLVTALDLATDIMVVSLPVIVLTGSLLNLSTKFGLAVFLCLSIFMAGCAIARISGLYYHGVEDDTWEFFWQHVEGAVGVMMASITAFRTLFVKPTNNNPEVSTPRSPAESFFRRIFARFEVLARAEPGEKPTTAPTLSMKLPKIPSPVFTGLRTFIRRNNRTTNANDEMATFATLDSVHDNDIDYHKALRESERSNPSSRGNATTHTEQSGQSRENVV